MAPQFLEPVAVIGMSCRFAAGANSPEKLWSLMSEGKNGWQDVPSDRFNWKSFYHPDPRINGTTNHRGGHFLDQDVAVFDSAFFSIPPSEAHAIDPQQRIQLEVAYEALENAGIPLDRVRGSNTAVYIATFSSDYDRMMFKDTSNIAKYHMTGVGSAIASNRISYFFDLKGPSITLDTGCSGSLVALHQACQSLQTGESSMALVGGTNLILSPDSMIPMSLLHILNSDGRCYSFDSRGSGYGRGEGVAMVVLKRLKDAQEAGDSVRAIIRGTGVNQDGKTPGITLPNQEAQQSLIQSVYLGAGLDPKDTGYVEAHGTGTVAGDITEVKSIVNSFCTGRKTPLYIGSIKSNIGHLESASGIAGLIKAVLVLEKGFIPPNVNLEDVKKDLGLDAQKIKIARTLEPWPITDHEKRYAAVNSFGYGGTNAHVILQDAQSNFMGTPETGLPNTKTTFNTSRPSESGPDLRSHFDGGEEDLAGLCNRVGDSIGMECGEENPPNSQHLSRRAGTPQLLVMTAKSERSLLEMLKNLATWVTDSPQKDGNLRDLAYTLSCHRSLMSWRYSMVATTRQDLASLHQGLPRMNKASTNVRITFLFTGQGAQWFAMGRELIRVHCEFTKSLHKSCQILRGLGAPWSLVRELLREKSTSRLHESGIAQPCTTAIQIALVDLFDRLGIRPGIVLGHSSGEIAAAYAAGILSQADALNVSYQRGITFNGSQKGKGAMLAVGLGEEDVTRQISQVQKGTVCVACINSHSSTTVSGDESAIVELKSILDNKSVLNRRLNVDVAYHSHHMREVAEQYLESLQGLNPAAPSASVQFISSVTGALKVSDFGPSYWVQNLVSKVRFSDALEASCQAQLVNAKNESSTTMHVFIELGPHSALSGPTNQTIKQLSLSPFRHSYLPSLVRDENAIHAVMRLAGRLFELGYATRFEVINSLDGDLRPCSVVQDIPSYPWDHSCKYWHESQTSKDDRLRPFPYHDLLGFRIVGGASYGSHWRHIISTENLPWLREHVIDNFTIFPGAGYLCMAIEGILQIVQDRKITGVVHEILIRDVVFSRALNLPASPGKTEIQLSLIPPHIEANRDSLGWEEFYISSRSQDGLWNEHCRGSIMVEFGSLVDMEQANYEESLDAANQRKRFWEMKEQCTQRLDTQVLYDELRSNGNAYGSNFANLEDIHIGFRQAVGSIIIPDITACMPSAFMQPHFIHPTTLDTVFQMAIPLFCYHSTLGSVMPVSIKKIAISASMNTQVGEKLMVGATLFPEGRRVATADILAFQSKSLSEISPVITISQVELCAIGKTSEDISDSSSGQNTTYQMEWGLDVDSLATNISTFTRSGTLSEKQYISLEQKNNVLERATAFYIKTCLDHLREEGLNVSEVPNIYLLKWMHTYFRSEPCQALLSEMTTTRSMQVLREVQTAGVEGEALSRVGDKLSSILLGQIDPLSLLLEDGLLYRLYLDDSSLQCCLHLSNFINHLIFKSPYMTILEIGAGTGGTTLPLLRALGGKTSFIKQYDYTDISSGFFDSARSKLCDWSEMLRFRTLNIERDPVDQGFEEASYDLIIASNALHATKCIDDTLANVQRLLKPGGRLALIEVTRLVPFINVIVGHLPGWWRGIEDGRQNCPLLSVEQWNRALSRNSFTGIDMAVKDFEGPGSKATMMISSTQKLRSSTAVAAIEILRGHTFDKHCQTFSAQLSLVLKEQGFRTNFAPWPSHQVRKDSIYVVLDSCERPLLAESQEEEFTQITKLITQGRRILWITLHENLSTTTQPEIGLVTGLARVARSENELLKFVTFDVQQCIDLDNAKLTRTISEVISTCFGILFENEKSEDEYAYRNNELLIPRLIPDAQISACVEIAAGNPKVETSLFHQPHRPLKLHVRQPGLLDSLIFVDDETALQPLGEDELQIRVMACGINFKDVFVALGRMKASTQMAGECAGIITAVGANMQTRFRIGNRVCAWNGTPYASYTRVNGSDAYIMLNSMSFTVGASIPVVFLTAYYSLIEVAHLQKDQSVLIHAATGGVGQAALIIAQHVKAKIYATAGTAAKRRLITERYGIPETDVFSSQSRIFKKGILRLTQGRGVDMILNSLSGNALADSWECIANFGIFVEIGKSDIYRKAHISMEPFDRNTTFAAVDMVAVATHQPEKMRLMLAKIMSMFESGALRAVQITTMAMTEIESAFRYIQARKHTGKVVLEVGDDTVVKVVHARPTPLRFDGDGTYVVAGGLGDIGQSICRLMASRGAKNILILSRRVLDLESQRIVEMSLAPYGVKAHIMVCDIGDSKKVREVVAWCHETMPPVKGIIQAAMVLQDRTLEHMTLADFRISLYSKFHGTINLSKAFESPDLDFFIMLSSAAGIVGTKAQGNYAAACVFQDAMAHSNSESSTHYLSLDLGMINDSSAIALHAERQRSLVRQGLIPLRLENVIALLEYSMSAPAREYRCKQLAIGFNRRSLSSQQRSRTLQNQIFSHLPYEADREATKQVPGTTVPVKETIAAAVNIEEIHSIVAGAIRRQLSTLLALEYDKISLDSSLTEFGLDSLIAVELRNWITRTLQAIIQTSDIFDAPNLRALIETVSSRSGYVLAYREAAVLNSVQSRVSSSGNHEPVEAEIQVTIPTKLVPNPLPNLENTLQLYLYSVRAFLSNEELEMTLSAIRDLQKSAGFGQVLQNRLAQRVKDPQIDNWLYDLYNAHVYLKVRAPVNPFQHFFGSHVATRDQLPHSQAERAAIISVAAFGFKERLEANELQPDFLNEQPLCMESLQWLFNSTRRPHVPIDRLQRFPGNDYLVALRHGHYYKIMLRDEQDSHVSFANLESKFQGILERDYEHAPSIAALTSCGRNDWAKLRDMVQEASEENRTLMGLIDAAAFIVCLDEGSPSNPTERANQFLVGDISNRWSDKTLQFVVCENAASAYLCDHAIVDGGTLQQINESIKSAILGHHKSTQCKGATKNLGCNSDEIENYVFASNAEIDQHISRVEGHFKAAKPAFEYSHFACTSFGTTFLRNHRCSPKAGYQLVIQLASRRYFGHQPPSWETISMRPFHKGRVDIIQTVLPPVFEFCASMQAKTGPASDRRSIFYEAAKAYTNTMTRISRGGGFASHLYALQEVIEEGEDLPLLFSDPTYANTRPRKIMTSSVPWQDSLQEAGFVLPDPENLWIQYEVDNDRCRFSIQGPVGRTRLFFDLVEAAAEEVKCLLEEE